jgi:hypothetical protein
MYDYKEYTLFVFEKHLFHFVLIFQLGYLEEHSHLGEYHGLFVLVGSS